MDTAVHGVTAPAAIYALEGRRVESSSPGFAEAIAQAHASRHRPRCLCAPGHDGFGIEMYVARIAGASGPSFIVKRMPDTGSDHAPDCPSYEPSADFSGLGQVLGSAITEDPATGETTLKLDFALSKMPGRSSAPPSGGISDSVVSDGTKLSLRGLLHYLWDQAELTHWHPGFAGKRTWGTVRKHLLQAAEKKITRGSSLRSRLYIPEMFSVEQRDAINARRTAQWAQAIAVPGKPQHLMLLIAEVKEIVPARYGFKAVVKHVPDVAFALDEQLYRRLGRRLGAELALWAASEAVHMVVIATCGVSKAGMPTIAEMSLMPVTAQWLPIEDAFERQLVERLVAEGRAFVKGLRYNLTRDRFVASATLTDASGGVSVLVIAPPGLDEAALVQDTVDPNTGDHATGWVWHPASLPMPPLPEPTAPVRAAEPHGSRSGTRLKTDTKTT